MIPYGSFYATLDAMKVADYCIFLLSPVEEVSPWGENLLRTLQAQGIPSAITAMAPSISSSQPPIKEHSSIQKSLLSFIKYFIPSQPKIFNLLEGAPSSENLNAIRALCEGKPSEVRWREGRSYMVADTVNWQAKNDGDSALGILSVTGVVRGAPLSANWLVHLPGYGDFKVSHVSDLGLRLYVDPC
jgi:pre-rRNA-processing protein TSR1